MKKLKAAFTTSGCAFAGGIFVAMGVCWMSGDCATALCPWLVLLEILGISGLIYWFFIRKEVLSDPDLEFNLVVKYIVQRIILIVFPLIIMRIGI